MPAKQAEIAPPGEFDLIIDRYMPYLVEIRRRLFLVMALFLTSAIIGFIYYAKIINFVLKGFSLEGVNIVFTSPFQFINLAITSGLLLGVIVIFPIVVFQIMSFLKPALESKEYRTLVLTVPVSIFLFVCGFIFGVLVMRYMMLIFYQRSLELNIGNFLDISLLLSQILVTAVLMGIAFQFPIVLTILMKFKIVKYQQIASQRLIAYTASIIFAALLPPTDILSLVVMTLPLVLLFEFTLILNKIVLKSHLL